MNSLRKRAISGSVWTVAGFGLSQVLRLGSNIVLAALLFEEAFAMMAIVAAITQGITMFSDIGLGTSVVQSKRGDERPFLDTAWTVQVLRGALLSLVVIATAWPVAEFYSRNDPLATELRYLLPIVALAMAISGFQSSKLWLNSRHMNLAPNTLIEVASQLAGMVAMVAIAWWTKSVYALAVGSIAMVAVTVTLSQFARPGPRDHFRIERAAFGEILKVGKWVFLSTGISFLAMQIDKLVFARMFPLDTVGVYSIAAGLAALAPTLMARIQYFVAFPLYSRALENSGTLPSVFSRAQFSMLTIGSAVIALLIACSQSFIDIAYDYRYEQAGRYLALLACGAWFAGVESMYGAAFLAVGRVKWLATGNAVKVAAFLILLWPLSRLYGMTGAIVAVAASDAVRLLVSWLLGRRIGLNSQWMDTSFLVLTAAAVGVSAAFSHWTPVSNWPPIGQLVVQGTLVTIVFLWPGLRSLAVLRKGLR